MKYSNFVVRQQCVGQRLQLTTDVTVVLLIFLYQNYRNICRYMETNKTSHLDTYLHTLICNAGNQKLLKEWEELMICPILKKGDATNCQIIEH